MPQDATSTPDKRDPAGSAGAGTGAPVTQDIGGVQGTSPEEDVDQGLRGSDIRGGPQDEPAPDAGEIEWAGQVVKKPPAPDA